MNTGFVYFVRAKNGTGPIKIGYSWRPEQRLETLLTWSPVDLEILVAIDADIETEKAIQNVFADLHWRREWFHPDARIFSATERLRAGLPIEKAIDLTDIRGNLWIERYRRRSIANAARRAAIRGGAL